jgi:ABC-type multidrug transport system fused ATPase/permease subunit
MSVLLFILNNLDAYKRRFWLAFLAGFTNSCASVAIPLLLATFTTTGLSHDSFVALVVWLMVAVLVSLVMSWYIRRHGEGVSFQFPAYLRVKFFAQIEQLPMSRLAKHHSGYIMSMVGQIADRISPILMDMFWWFSGIIVNVGLLIYFTATKSFGLTLFNLALFLTFTIVSTIMARKMTRLADVKSKQMGVFSQYFVDFMSNIVTIKRLGIRDFANQQLAERGNALNKRTQDYQNAHSNRWFILHTIYFTANFATIGYLLYQISVGALPVSLLIVFISFYGNLRTIIERIAENIITFAETRVYIKNLSEILEGDELPAGARRPAKQWQHITVTDVAFRHAENAVVVRVPAMNIKRGDRVCIYGTSGEGKTTVLNLLANYLPIEQGERAVDGIAYGDLDRALFADESSFISQETELFNLSLRDNLTLGQTVTDKKLWQLLEDLQLGDWARGLQDGLNTIIGEKGLRLSAGQKQRVNLARGILLDRSLYLLDEPTSHLDDATEKAVITAIEKYLGDKTIVVVTHRPAIKKICKSFYKMSGHVVTADA